MIEITFEAIKNLIVMIEVTLWGNRNSITLIIIDLD